MHRSSGSPRRSSRYSKHRSTALEPSMHYGRCIRTYPRSDNGRTTRRVRSEESGGTGGAPESTTRLKIGSSSKGWRTAPEEVWWPILSLANTTSGFPWYVSDMTSWLSFRTYRNPSSQLEARLAAIVRSHPLYMPAIFADSSSQSYSSS